MIQLLRLFLIFTPFHWGLAQHADFVPLAAKGAIPLDFTNYTIEKINAKEHNHSEEFLALSKKHQKHFLKAVHQGIDDILRSGKVLFGDTLTKYVNAVGQKILGDDESLKHIRFYTLKTNVVNAFSTNQGIIFVSQGLVAQVKNEAQLAFVLAHELAHYTERHVIVGFKENMELMRSSRSMSEKIKRYSIYSKDKEYEADRIGVKLYNRAGYNLSDLYSIFDLLSFSYLPFESKPVQVDFFSTEKLYFPKSFFKNELPKVAPDEDVDDSRSTHPNIKSRKDQLSGEIPKYDTWDDKVTLTSQSQFEFARSLARMEQIRNNLYEFDYIAALYNVYLLDDQLRDNLYFNQYKAQTWLGLLIFKTFSRFSDISSSLTRIQGEQHQMHHVIRALNRRQLATLAMRNIYDIRKKFPEDDQIQRIYEQAITNLAGDDKFRLRDFYTLSYKDAYEKYGSDANANAANGLDASQLAINRAKYGFSNDGKIDDNDFFKFALSDVVQDEDFVNRFEQAAKKRKSALENEGEKLVEKAGFLSKLFSNSDSIGIEQASMQQGIERLILLEPRGFAATNNRTDVIESEQLEITIKEAFENLQVDFMQVVKIGSKELKGASSEIYNEKSVLMNTLTQLMEYKELQLFPVDYAEIQRMRIKYQTDKVAFLVLDHNEQPWKTKLAILATTTTLPALSFALQKSASRFTFSMILFDLKNYTIDGVLRYQLHGKPNATAIEALSYNMLRILNRSKTTNQ